MEKIFKILSKALQEKNPKEIILCDKVNGTLKLNNKTFNIKICILTIDNNLFIIYSGKKYILEDIKSHENIWNTFKFKYKYTEQYSIYFVKYIILYMIVIEGKRFQLENSTLILFKKYLNINQISR